jgi:hypothetical protein
MIQLGDFAVNAIVDFKWNTNGANGASITRATNGTIRIYKNNSTTERSSSNGITDTEDFDTLTGVHHCRIDLSDNTDAGFYAAGSDYDVVLAGATIDGQTVNAVLAHFSIANRTPRANVVQVNGSAINNLISGRVDANAQVVGDKTGYTAATVSDKTGYSLSASGLNSVVTAEPGSIPAFGNTIVSAVSLVMAFCRNKITQTSSSQTLRNDADNATIGTSTHSDDGTTHVRGKFV